MKRYLLIVNEYYYPSVGPNDWIGFFDTPTEAEEYLQSRFNESVEDHFIWKDYDSWSKRVAVSIVDIFNEMEKDPKKVYF